MLSIVGWTSTLMKSAESFVAIFVMLVGLCLFFS
jgi:hypothetical protein